MIVGENIVELPMTDFVRLFPEAAELLRTQCPIYPLLLSDPRYLVRWRPGSSKISICTKGVHS